MVEQSELGYGDETRKERKEDEKDIWLAADGGMPDGVHVMGRGLRHCRGIPYG